MRPVAIVLSLIIMLGIVVVVVDTLRHQGEEESAAASSAPIEAPEVTETGPQPKLVIEEQEYDFGEMLVDSSETKLFTLRNEGEGELVLTAGHSTCKCTEFTIADEKVPPGGETTVKLTWHPKNVSTEFQQSAEIHTNQAGNDLVRLVIKGKVFKQMEIAPLGNWRLGTIDTKVGPATVTGVIFSRFLDEFEIVEIENDNEYVKVTSTPLNEKELAAEEAKCGYKIIAAVQPNVPSGRLESVFRIKTDVLDGATFPITLEGTRPGPFRIVAGPNVFWDDEGLMLSLRRFEGEEGTKVDFSFFLDQPDGGAEITEITTDDKLMSIDFKVDEKFSGKTKRRYILTVRVAPGPPRQVEKGTARTVTIKTTHPELPSAEIKCLYSAI